MFFKNISNKIPLNILSIKNDFFCSLRRLVAEFQHGGRHNLSHLVLDPARSRLYVAGTNVLYQLDDALRVSHKVETGETRGFTS